MDLFLLVVLILLNGLLAMSEIAVVSARKARLQKLADDGSPGARSALELSHEPSGFLSTVQVGITTVGILSGAIGENAIADPLTQWLAGFPWLEPYARGLELLSVKHGPLDPARSVAVEDSRPGTASALAAVSASVRCSAL